MIFLIHEVLYARNMFFLLLIYLFIFWSQKNHLSGIRKTYLKISFDTVQQLMNVKSDLVHVVKRNQAEFDAAQAYESILAGRRYVLPRSNPLFVK